MRRPVPISTVLRGLAALGLLILVGSLAFVLYARSLPLPKELERDRLPSLHVLDRHGILLARLKGSGDVWHEPLRPSDLGPFTKALLLAAEDARFDSHPGIDPLAIARAAAQAALHGRIVSGASTITQQLARTTFPRQRTLLGKLEEMALALRIEASWSKERILLAYLNAVDFGPHLLGMQAASERYFGKPIAALDLAETALLVGIVRGPSLYDPERRLDLAERRRDRILGRAAARGLVPRDDVERALRVRAALRPHLPQPGAWHWVQKSQRQPGTARAPETHVSTTLDWTLQREVEELVGMHGAVLAAAGARTAAVVVLDTESGEVLGYLGSRDAHSTIDLGQNDGATTRRQPGSALKPFLYASAVDQLGLGANTLLPDEPRTFHTPSGYYTPENFDRRFRGPVTVRRALSSSLNLPAVTVLERLGVDRGLGALREFGFVSLDQPSSHYGLGLALGSGEVTLLELTGAYAALGRGGVWRPLRTRLGEPAGSGRRVVSERAAHLVSDILADEQARREMFPAGLDPAATLGQRAHFSLKTGTSTGYRDAWAVAYDQELTVGVWVGNFDGRPMHRTTGATGAAPLAALVWSRARDVLGRAERPPEAGERPPEAGEMEKATSLRAQEDLVSDRPAITFPVNGAHFTWPRSSARGESNRELVFVTREAARDHGLYVDGVRAELDGQRSVVRLGAGGHQAELRDAGGRLLSEVRFVVELDGRSDPG